MKFIKILGIILSLVYPCLGNITISYPGGSGGSGSGSVGYTNILDGGSVDETLRWDGATWTSNDSLLVGTNGVVTITNGGIYAAETTIKALGTGTALKVLEDDGDSIIEANTGNDIRLLTGTDKWTFAYPSKLVSACQFKMGITTYASINPGDASGNGPFFTLYSTAGGAGFHVLGGKDKDDAVAPNVSIIRGGDAPATQQFGGSSNGMPIAMCGGIGDIAAGGVYGDLWMLWDQYNGTSGGKMLIATNAYTGDARMAIASDVDMLGFDIQNERLDYGQLNIDDGAVTNNCAIAGTYYQITGWTTNINENVALTVSNMTVSAAGLYEVSGAVSFSGDATKTFEAAVHLNGVHQNVLEFKRKLGATGDVGAVSLCGLINVPANGVLDLRVKCVGSTGLFIVEQATLYAIKQ